MDLFTDTVAASAKASNFSTSDTATDGDTDEPVTADYVRPTAVRSDYLDAGFAKLPPA
ncbi:hypothetical protein ABNF97_32000 [Plantactinospora sp. B6F1]|uniref:hypothetical protein n=1 Tax=Plantactinospora sp. B6F1 TaxID=3158971 RepID=UPI0032D9A564